MKCIMSKIRRVFSNRGVKLGRDTMWPLHTNVHHKLLSGRPTGALVKLQTGMTQDEGLVPNLFLPSSWAMSSLFCLFTSKLMLRLGITWKAHAKLKLLEPAGLIIHHLTIKRRSRATERCVYVTWSTRLCIYIVFAVYCVWENKLLLTHSRAVSLCQAGGVAGDQFVLLVFSAGTVHTTDTHTHTEKGKQQHKHLFFKLS